MVQVAIAGGAGKIGGAIVNGILKAGKHTPVILSRSSKPAPPNVELRVVDYSDHGALVSSLQGIHTIIVASANYDEKEFLNHQLALIKAAKEAGVKRFAPSEWALKDNTGIPMYTPKLTVWEEAKKSGLEVTRFMPGFFINLFAGGSHLPSEKEATVGYTGKFMIDARAGTADIPGDGTANVTFTSAQDAAKFVAASLDLETWEEESSFVGESTTFEKVVGIAEEITGKKFVRTYLKEGGGEKAEKLLESPFWKSIAGSLADGKWEVTPTLNRKFPDIHTDTVEEYLRRYWEGAKW